MPKKNRHALSICTAALLFALALLILSLRGNYLSGTNFLSPHVQPIVKNGYYRPANDEKGEPKQINEYPYRVVPERVLPIQFSIDTPENIDSINVITDNCIEKLVVNDIPQEISNLPKEVNDLPREQNILFCGETTLKLSQPLHTGSNIVELTIRDTSRKISLEILPVDKSGSGFVVNDMHYDLGDGEIVSNKHPLNINNAPMFGIIDFNMHLQKFYVSEYVIKPDDCLHKLVINNKLVIDKNIPFCDNGKGQSLNLATYLHPGDNTITATISDTQILLGVGIETSSSGKIIMLLNAMVAGIILLIGFVIL